MADGLSSRLAPWRQKIDTIDTQILDLLNQRARFALEIGAIKKSHADDEAILRPEREALIIRHLQDINSGPITAESVEAVWNHIISACRGLESRLSVAYLGPRGSFSEQAAIDHFGHAVDSLPCASFDEVFKAVESGAADVGMVPVENSTEGAVNRCLDLLLGANVMVLGERSIPIRHHLLSRSGSMDGITCILGHPQALAQCQTWLARHYPALERRPASSNSQASSLAAQDASLAAIAGETAARAWGLQTVAASIQDDPHNQTRFLAIGQQDAEPTGQDKTSLILAVPNRAGAVYEMLAPLAQHGVSMTRLESRPARTGQWEYYFYLDFIGHRTDPSVEQALAKLRAHAAFYKELGSYPRQEQS